MFFLHAQTTFGVTTINTIPVRINFERAAQEMQTSKITNSSGLTMKSDTGQHLQVLRCFDLKKTEICLCLKSSIFGEIFIDSGMICVQLNIQRMMWMLMKVICNIHIYVLPCRHLPSPQIDSHCGPLQMAPRKAY